MGGPEVEVELLILQKNVRTIIYAQKSNIVNRAIKMLIHICKAESTLHEQELII